MTTLTLSRAVDILDLCLDKFDSAGGYVMDAHDEDLRNAVLNNDIKEQKVILQKIAKALEKIADTVEWFAKEYEDEARVFIDEVKELAKVLDKEYVAALEAEMLTQGRTRSEYLANPGF